MHYAPGLDIGSGNHGCHRSIGGLVILQHGQKVLDGQLQYSAG